MLQKQIFSIEKNKPKKKINQILEQIVGIKLLIETASSAHNTTSQKNIKTAYHSPTLLWTFVLPIKHLRTSTGLHSPGPGPRPDHFSKNRTTPAKAVWSTSLQVLDNSCINVTFNQLPICDQILPVSFNLIIFYKICRRNYMQLFCSKYKFKYNMYWQLHLYLD